MQLESQLPQGMSGDKLRALEEGPKLGEPAAPQPDAEPPRFIKEVRLCRPGTVGGRGESRTSNAQTCVTITEG